MNANRITFTGRTYSCFAAGAWSHDALTLADAREYMEAIGLAFDIRTDEANWNFVRA